MNYITLDKAVLAAKNNLISADGVLENGFWQSDNDSWEKLLDAFVGSIVVDVAGKNSNVVTIVRYDPLWGDMTICLSRSDSFVKIDAADEVLNKKHQYVRVVAGPHIDLFPEGWKTDKPLLTRGWFEGTENL